MPKYKDDYVAFMEKILEDGHAEKAPKQYETAWLSGCLLATHQLQYLKNVDHIAVMEKGTIVHQGGYEELKEKGAFVGLVKLPESLEEEPGGVL